jgi:acyl-CoA thioester hydrolase
MAGGSPDARLAHWIIRQRTEAWMSVLDEGGTAAACSSVLFSPFVSSSIRVRQDWIDYNGHMNIAHYTALFDTALDELFAQSGLGPDYVSAHNQSFFVVESRMSYRQELTEGDPVRVTVQLIAVDDKRVHCYLEVRHAFDGWVAASAETLLLHVDLGLRRATPLLLDRRADLQALCDRHAALPRPGRLGMGITMPRQATVN